MHARYRPIRRFMAFAGTVSVVLVLHHAWSDPKPVVVNDLSSFYYLALAIMTGAVVGAFDYSISRRSQRRAAGLCPNCCYDRAGTEKEDRCPECGHKDFG